MTLPMVKIEGVPEAAQAIPGMAFFAGTGPEGKKCGDCIHRGYKRVSSRETWSERAQACIAKTYRTQGCAEFKRLAGHHGPAVDTDNAACKFFEQKPKE